ncbi:MAG: hypothetical protein BWY67_01998 [Bacteroidetes bacterium ADurb.Bin397]|nr:MAG: hypothetical protein BWY67_01998 [Bacteroidetes bacterium ADurb.Bin397]
MVIMSPAITGFGNNDIALFSVMSSSDVSEQFTNVLNAFALPYPQVTSGKLKPVKLSCTAQFMIAFLTCIAVAVGFCCRYKAAIPATTGEEELVPPSRK